MRINFKQITFLKMAKTNLIKITINTKMDLEKTYIKIKGIIKIKN